MIRRVERGTSIGNIVHKDKLDNIYNYATIIITVTLQQHSYTFERAIFVARCSELHTGVYTAGW